MSDQLKVSFRPDLCKKIQKKFISKYASKFISKSTLKSMFKLTTYSKFKSTSVKGCFGIYIYNCFYIQNNSAQNCFSIFGILCSSSMDLHLFGELSVEQFQNFILNIHCVSCIESEIMGMKMCGLQCTVAILVFLSYTHTFVWGNDKLICCFVCVCVCSVTDFSVITWLWCSSTNFILQ